MQVSEQVLAYAEAGLCVLPAVLTEKRPALPGWKQFQRQRPTEDDLRRWFTMDAAVCVLTGAVSGNLELLDFDAEGELFERWREFLATEAPGLVERLVIERSQSGGRHVIYRCEEPIPGSHKLAQRTLVLPSAEPVMLAGKQHVPRPVGQQFEVTITLIETRGEGGLFLCAPSPGYVLEQEALTTLPVLTTGERALLIEAACALNEVLPTPEPRDSICGQPDGTLPGDDFNLRGNVRDVLCRHGWQLVRPGENEYWRRPGKERGCSATLKDGIFYVFSSNAPPFEPNRGYSGFAVLAWLDHGGDFRAAASALRAQGYGDGHRSHVDLSRILNRCTQAQDSLLRDDPGPLPVEMFRVPGFISEVMDHCLATAPYPNIPLAFCGALALQAMLAGRKVRDQADNRTNIYLLGLAFSAVGKDWPRKVNTRVLYHAGLIEALGEKFASGEGIQDALYRTPSMLFQTDEIDGLLQAINKAQDAHHENILGTLLTIYSSANTIFPMRRKAGQEYPGVINQPSLVVLGTAIPTHYYDALSERMLTNGFFARMLIVESGHRGVGQEPGIIAIPSRVLDTATWWSQFCPGTGNLRHFHPVPAEVVATDDARALLAEARQVSESEYATAEARNDPVGTTVWGRVPEHIRKLALLYAVSANHQAPRVDAAAVRWAREFALHQTRRMLFMAQNHVAANPFHRQLLKLRCKLREAPERKLIHSVLLKRMKTDARTFLELVSTLEQQGDLVTEAQTTAGRTHRAYRLIGDE